MGVNVAKVLADYNAGGQQGGNQKKLTVYGAVSDTGTKTKTFTVPQREFVFANDTADAVTIQILGNNELDTTFNVLGNEVLDERISDFTSAVVTSAGAWRLYTRCAVLP